MELAVQRKLTRWFIREDPKDIILVPRVKMPTASGGFRWEEMPPRAVQTVKFVEPPVTPADPVITADGQQREVSFLLVLEHDAVIGEYDIFEALGYTWEIIQLYHFNGYERRAAVARYG